MVGRIMHDFRRRFMRNGIVKAILHHCIELLGSWGIAVIVDTAFCIDVRHLLPNAALAGANRAHTLQQFAEVIFAESSFALLQAVIIHGKAFDHVLFQHTSRPNAELRGSTAVDAVADGNNGIQIIKINEPLDSSASLFLNYFHFGNS